MTLPDGLYDPDPIGSASTAQIRHTKYKGVSLKRS